LHEKQPLNLGTVTFHYAALISQLQLNAKDLGIILDKFVPDPDEDPGDDVIRIISTLKETQILGAKEMASLEPRRLQKLVSAWRYNSFGHHKEDGLVLYNRISMCAHSCDPTCCWSYGEEDAFVLRARITLKAGEELTISYLQDEDLLKGTCVRQQKLQNWRFTCMCSRCKLTTDVGRGFKCRSCNVGVCHVEKLKDNELPSGGSTSSSLNYRMLECNVCRHVSPDEEQRQFLKLEEEYVARVESLDKNDVQDVLQVFQAAIEIFDKHWILYVMDTYLWEAYRESSTWLTAIQHQQRRIMFHQHYYFRPTFILAWCHEELGDAFEKVVKCYRWDIGSEYQQAFHMLKVLCGMNHQYTQSPQIKYNNLQQAQAPVCNGTA